MYPATSRTTATRLRERISYERAVAEAILDEALVCHLGFVAGGTPRVLPMLHVRVGDTLYLHGSTGSHAMREALAGGGLAVCVTATLLDGLVLARSHFKHSVNYRSAVVHGTARLVAAEADKRAGLDALVDKVARGRAGDSRPPTARELAATAVLAVPLAEVSAKVRLGGPSDEPEDMALPYWAGVLPLRVAAGPAEPAPGVTAAVPGYLRPERSPWLTAAPMRGTHVILEPLDLSHAEGLLAAVADPEVYRFMSGRQPADRAEMAAQVAQALDAHERGVRVPWVQRHAATGEIIGTTSYYEINERDRSLAIGYTMLGRPWWRTGVNTESKLLLMRRAFEELGAVRVVWHTHSGNVRSQRAIERLGATREGLLRRHRLLANGSWRDTVQYAMTVDAWPAARDRLAARLAGGAAQAGVDPADRPVAAGPEHRHSQ